MSLFKKGDRVQLVSDLFGSMIGQRGIVTGVLNGITVSVDWDDDTLPLPMHLFDFQVDAVHGETRIVNRDTDTIPYIPCTLTTIPRTSVSALSRQVQSSLLHQSNVAGKLRGMLIVGMLVAITVIGGFGFVSLTTAANNWSNKITERVVP